MSSSSGLPRDQAHGGPLPSTITGNSKFRSGEVELEGAASEVIREMADAWHHGQRKGAEYWIDRYPEIGANSDAAVRVIYEEICLREERGETVASSEVFSRFPQWRQALEVLFDCHRLMDAVQPTAVFPTAGQRLGDLELLCELGRGAVGRVFLATQSALSDRPLVVKLTPRSGVEHLSLARLQHTHIAPLYLVQDFPDENLRALCMPYVGGASWSSLLEALNVRPPQERTGRHILEALDAAQRAAPLAVGSTQSPASRFLSRATYMQAVCWIGSCLADALQYAHQRGLVHLDIKPSNVLLAADGQPMLLDFHLAREMVPAGGGPLERLGGTPGYMSSEQESATKAVREGRRLTVALDGRSDIYSLGALLYESLGGRLPPTEEAKRAPRLSELNPQVSRGLEDMISKCLARDPADRYDDAGQLATDLRRHLADLPLVGVANRSPVERWHKWRRRKPLALAMALTTVVALFVVGGVALLFRNERSAEARLALEQGQQSMANRDYTPAIERFEAGLRAVRPLPGQHDLERTLQTQLAAAKHARLAARLHELVERLRFVDTIQVAPRAKLAELAAGCARIWNSRAQIVEAEGAQRDSEIARQLRADLSELVQLWAELQIRLATPEAVDDARRQALALLEETQALCGSSFGLELARAEYRAPDGSPSAVELSGLVPHTAREHFAVGRLLFRSGALERAQREFQESIRLEPNGFWANFYAALTAYRLEHFEDALMASSVCVALEPTSAECFYNRALAHQALDQREQALDDFTRALSIDPTLAVAATGRGMLLANMRRYPAAIADFQNALARGASPAEIYYQMALVQLDQNDRPAARQSLDRALLDDADYEPAVTLQKRLDSER